MDSRRLLTFRAVAHARSFSRAAESLSLSQPSVSHQIALLETEIGVRLLERGRGGLRLTPAGEVLLEHADHVAWRLQLASTQIAARPSSGRDRRSNLPEGARTRRLDLRLNRRLPRPSLPRRRLRTPYRRDHERTARHPRPHRAWTRRRVGPDARGGRVRRHRDP